MSSTAAVLQLQQRETFEQNLTRVLIAGAGAGALAWAMGRLVLPVPLVALALAATALAHVRGARLERLVLGLGGLLLTVVPWALGMSRWWTIAFSGAAVGVVMVKARLMEKGAEGSVGAERPGRIHFVVTAALTAGLAMVGTEVAQVLTTRLQDFSAPMLLRALAGGTVVALFAGLGSITSHLALKADPVEARGEEVLMQVAEPFASLVRRGLGLYRQCGQALGALPRDSAREELARTVQQLSRDSFELAAEWAGVEATFHESTERELAREVAELKAAAGTTKDGVAKRQLEQAAESLTEELSKLDDVKTKRERVIAKLKSQLALLERARVSLLGMRSSHASIRAAEMASVARKLSALATAQADEAAVAHEVATATELTALDLQQGEAGLRQALQSDTVFVDTTKPSV